MKSIKYSFLVFVLFFGILSCNTSEPLFVKVKTTKVINGEVTEKEEIIIETSDYVIFILCENENFEPFHYSGERLSEGNYDLTEKKIVDKDGNNIKFSCKSEFLDFMDRCGYVFIERDQDQDVEGCFDFTFGKK